jgi:glycosyltransferase involved in cell wall biosynthesis
MPKKGLSAQAGTPPARAGTPRVLCAIPCFNEEVAIGSVVLQAKPHVTEVLVIDDGSDDRTAEVARLAGAQVLVHERNSGKGLAVQNAFRYARDHGFDALVLMDGDGQHDPKEIPLLLAPVLAGTDVGLGFRFGDKTEMPGWRRVGKRVLDYATAAGGAGVVTDSQCGFRAFGRKAIEEMADGLAAKGFGVESEQLVVARERGLTMQNVTIHCRYEGVDGSTKGPVAHAAGVLASLVENVTRRRPLIFMGLPSIALLLAGASLALYMVHSYNQSGYYSLALALLTLALTLVGVLGLVTSFILNLVSLLEGRIVRMGR